MPTRKHGSSVYNVPLLADAAESGRQGGATSPASVEHYQPLRGKILTVGTMGRDILKAGFRTAQNLMSDSTVPAHLPAPTSRDKLQRGFQTAFKDAWKDQATKVTTSNPNIATTAELRQETDAEASVPQKVKLSIPEANVKSEPSKPKERRSSWKKYAAFAAVVVFLVLFIGAHSTQIRQALPPQNLEAQDSVVEAAVWQSPANQAPMHLRAQSNATSFSFWNNAIGRPIQLEIEMQEKPQKANKLVYAIMTMSFGLFGCDRCYMGQYGFGVMKGFTLGGFLVWQMIDYIICVVNCLSKDKSIKTLGYNHVFEKDSINTAYYTAAVLLLLQLIQQIRACMNTKDQMEIQQQQQEALIAADPDLDIPKREQSLAYMPTMLTSTLRKAGMVSEKPTIPEMIALFNKLDKDGDGQLDHDEIKEGMAAMGVSEETVNEMIKSADTDGDGKLSKDEWLIAMAEQKKN